MGRKEKREGITRFATHVATLKGHEGRILCLCEINEHVWSAGECFVLNSSFDKWHRIDRQSDSLVGLLGSQLCRDSG